MPNQIGTFWLLNDSCGSNYKFKTRTELDEYIEENEEDPSDCDIYEVLNMYKAKKTVIELTREPVDEIDFD